MEKNPLLAAVEKYGQTGVARAIGTSQQNIANWIAKDDPRLPGEFVLSAEAAFGVPRHVWRPDLYPPAEYAQLLVCGVCDRRASDPECSSCLRPDCGLRQREAA